MRKGTRFVTRVTIKIEDCVDHSLTGTEGAEGSMVAARNDTWNASCRKAWTLHFIVCFMAMAAGILYNGNSVKLIPSRLRQDGCTKVLINVLSPSEESGTVCCSKNMTSDAFGTLCSNRPFPPLYSRLTRFPDAWIIPLIPIILRGLALALETLLTNRPSESWSTYLTRFHVYMLVLSLRFFVLFLGFNWVERQVVGGPPKDCWFSGFVIQREGRSSCKSIPFDFSDHTVLYFGQILVIPLTEIVYAWLLPVTVGGVALSRLVSASLLYLYFITLFGEFHTAAYHHTGEEILVGYIISFLLQLPMAYLQCYPTWSRIRARVFGISTLNNERTD